LLDLNHAERRSFWRLLVSAAADATRVAVDDVVVHGGVEDRTQQPVGLSHHGGRYAFIEQRGTPTAHDQWRQIAEPYRSQLERQVPVKQPSVEVGGTWP
jgi:hypothetical protein